MNEAWSHDGWYYHRDDSMLGPLTWQEIQALVKRGVLEEESTLWKGWRKSGDALHLPIRLDRLAMLWDEPHVQEKPV